MSNKKKSAKKKVQNRKMRRTVMGTLSVVFMLSAIIVALIPTPKSEAANDDDKIQSVGTVSDVTGDSSKYIPDYSGYPVYSSGDGAILMAYGYKYNDTISKAGVIVNCNSKRITNGTLQIEQEVPAYLHYKEKYVAVNKDNQPLYYISSRAGSVATDSNGNMLGLNDDADFTLCTADCESEWLNKEGVVLYTDKTPKDPILNGIHIVSANSIEVENYTKSEQLCIPVNYIGSVSCTPGNGQAESWANATSNITYNAKDYALDGEELHVQGVFEGIGGLSKVILPSDFVAVGDNAFRGSGISSFDVGAHLSYIGNHAFQDSMLTTVNFFTVNEGDGKVSNLNVIGDYAFSGSKLNSIGIPDSVTSMGNFCFKDCKNLQAADLGNGSIRMLVGHGLFYECDKLGQVIFPDNVSNIDEVQYTFFKCKTLTYLGLPDNSGRKDEPHVFAATNVMGCNALKTVNVPNTQIKMDCNDPEKVGLTQYNEHGDLYTNATYDIFSADNLGYDAPRNEKYEVSDEFCIFANQNSYAYAYAMEHGLAFGYLDPALEDRYEKTIDGYTFSINQAGELEYCNKIGQDGENVVIPSKIFKFNVTKIMSSAFQNNKEMKFVYIPDEVMQIEDGAFAGCTELRTVYFENANDTSLTIGEGAFKTGATCVGYADDGTAGVSDCLRFIGDISDTSPAYQYAMDSKNTYNGGGAKTQYITYCTTFPQNLQVRLEADSNGTLVPTLVAVPTEEQLASMTSSSSNVGDVLENGYSLNCYSGEYIPELQNQRENQIALDAYAHYLSDPSMNSLTADEVAVMQSVLNITVPEGVRNISDTVFKGNTGVESVKLENVYEIPANAFEGCSSLTSFVMDATDNPDQEKVGEYAFKDCDKLSNVTLSNSLKQMDSIPFTGCTTLKDVGFSGSENFECVDGIIYQINSDGTRTIIECLENRGLKDGVGSSVVGPSDFENVSAIKPYAFYDCSGITIADLSNSTVTEVPKSCFENDTSLFMCSLPETLRTIGDDAFRNTKLSKLDIPVDAANISDTAFLDENGSLIDTMTVECPDGPTGLVWSYFNNLGVKTDRMDPSSFKVIFIYGDQYDLQVVEKGKAATPPTVDDKKFIGWSTDDYKNVQEDLFVKAVYDTKNNVQEGRIRVRFMDEDTGYVYSTQHLLSGECVHEPATTPTKTNYIFMDWDPSNYLEIPVTEEWDIFARFEKDPNAKEEDPNQICTVTFVDIDGKTVLDSQKVAYGKLPVPTTVIPKREGYEFTTWSPSNYAEIPVTSDLTVTALYQKSAVDQSNNTSGNAGADVAGGDIDSSGSSSNKNNAGASSNKNNNSNSGSSTQGGSNAATPAASSTPNSTTGKKNSSVSGNGTSFGSTTKKNTTSGKESAVEVSKTGISNKGLVSASVTGSNDNFIVKIKDSDEAKAQVEQALLANYGTLDNLKYFAMDISLYDSTGTSEIADTTGITVTVTMPLPDVMAGYAGNNKAMAVKNGAMEKLNSRLITIDNVPCISFEATHFSPYAIYVETNNLSATGVSDATPKTGDPIHPKWFLALGLALLSVIMFLGKGSKNKIVKVIK